MFGQKYFPISKLFLIPNIKSLHERINLQVVLGARRIYTVLETSDGKGVDETIRA